MFFNHKKQPAAACCVSVAGAHRTVVRFCQW